MSKLPMLCAVAAVLIGALGPWMMAGEPKRTDATLVAWLACGALVAVFAGFLAGRRDETSGSTWPGLAGVLLAGGCLATLGMAVGAERQNYWDAWHFASILWAGAGSAAVGLVAVWTSRSKTNAAAFALPFAALLMGAYLLLWSWMTFAFVQDIEGAIVRWTYLITHG